MKKIIGSALLVSLLAGCPSATAPAQSIQVDGATVNAKLTSVRPSKPDGQGSLVFGTLQIIGQEEIKSANLDCVALKWGNSHSERIYVDSVTSVLTNPFPAKNGQIFVNVYWVLPNATLSARDLISVQVEKVNKLTGCITCL